MVCLSAVSTVIVLISVIGLINRPPISAILQIRKISVQTIWEVHTDPPAQYPDSEEAKVYQTGIEVINEEIATYYFNHVRPRNNSRPPK